MLLTPHTRSWSLWKIRDCSQSKESGTKIKIDTLKDSNPWPSIHKVGMHSIYWVGLGGSLAGWYVTSYKHRWNTRWAFARKHDIFTCEKNVLSARVKISPLLRLHNKSRLSHQKLLKWNGLVFHWCLYNKLHTLMKYFSTLEEKFRISARPCNILYLCFACC